MLGFASTVIKKVPTVRFAVIFAVDEQMDR